VTNLKTEILKIKYTQAFIYAVICLLTCCETPSVPLSPDYTGQKGFVSDIEGNVYKTVGIGSQIWMAENLRTTRLNDNTPIPMIARDSLWEEVWQAPGYCYYNNDSVSNKRTYGPLYNYYVVQTGKLCPAGWHVPESAEWNTLVQFLGGEGIAGGKLKDYNTTLWDGPNPCIANNFDFSALPGGMRKHYQGQFGGIGTSGFWWTNTQTNTFNAYLKFLSCYDKGVYEGEYNKRDGCSVRCVKDR